MSRIGIFLVCMWLWDGTAWAQSAPTCSFNAGTARLTVEVNGIVGQLKATSSGVITLEDVPCGAATVSNTDFIRVTGGELDDTISLIGTFAPGLTPDVDGGSEIEISVSFYAGMDMVNVSLSGGQDVLTLSAGGVNTGNDGDQDVTIGGTEEIHVFGRNGVDEIDGSLYTGAAHLFLHGGEGNDFILGSAAGDTLYGEGGDDTIEGGSGADLIIGGPGDDSAMGDAGADTFRQDAAMDGSDFFEGGAGVDTIDYGMRSNPVVVTLATAVADDGEAGENDFMALDVENAIGGGGNDNLVAGSQTREMRGGGGSDEMIGAAASQTLIGGGGDDFMTGGGGTDVLDGGPGDDTLDGGAGTDQYLGGPGNDVFLNGDGMAETVDCGPGGADDPEPSVLDTFIACELI